MKFITYVLVAVMVTLSSVSVASVVTEVPKMHFAGEYVVPTSAQFEGTKIGGLSAIAWDSKREKYYAINDSRNNTKEGNALLYTLDIDATSKGISHVKFLTKNLLTDKDGIPFPENKIDAEGLALTPDGRYLFISSELGTPLYLSTLSGEMVSDLSDVIPSKFNIKGDKDSPIGVRDGTSWEGVSISPDGKSLWLAVESTLKQDGEKASPIDAGRSRIIKFNYDPGTFSLKLEKELLYMTDPVPQVTSFGVNDNGISDVLALGNDRLLVIERSGRNVSEGFNDWDFNVRVYLADASTSSDISSIDSLNGLDKKSTIQTVVKKLLIDFSTITDTPDCIEGITFGPLIDGKKTLVFVSDNNFQPHQSTKFYLFIDKDGVLN